MDFFSWGFLDFCLSTLYNTVSSAAHQIQLCRRMLGSKPGQLRRLINFIILHIPPPPPEEWACGAPGSILAIIAHYYHGGGWGVFVLDICPLHWTSGRDTLNQMEISNAAIYRVLIYTNWPCNNSDTNISNCYHTVKVFHNYLHYHPRKILLSVQRHYLRMYHHAIYWGESHRDNFEETLIFFRS